MSNEEALKILLDSDRVGVNIINANDEQTTKYNNDSVEALCMAIKALEQEPCEDAVSRADTLQSFESYCEKNCQYSKKQRDVMCGACMMGDAIEIVENLPPVTPKPRTGKWLFVQRGKCVDMCCNECKSVRIKDYAYNYTVDQIIADKENVVELFAQSDMQYCPNCGAKMEGESE